MTWYSTDKHLPDTFKAVLVYTQGAAPSQAVHEGYYTGTDWVIGCAALKFRPDEITHWADIPEFEEENI